MTMNPPISLPIRIACLGGSKLYSHDLLIMLHSVFAGHPVSKVSAHHITPEHLKNYDLLVLPGIIGHDSPYPDIIPASKAPVLREALDRGLVIWSECAATYYMLSNMEYLAPNGRRKEKSGLGLVMGHASGPAYRHRTRALPKASHQNDIVLARLLRNDGSLVRAFDINGPALHIDDGGTTGFLRYADIDDQPAAGFTKRFGRGLLVGLSIHPEISPHSLGNHPSLRHLFSKAMQHNPSRLSLLDDLRSMVLGHIHGLKKDGNSSPILLGHPHHDIT